MRTAAILAVLGGFLMALGCPQGMAADADIDWQRVTELDAGPRTKAQSQTEARQVAVTHMADQERALRNFITQHGRDRRAFEARLRLSRLLQIRADFEKSDKLRTEARQWLELAGKTATPEQQVEVDFAQVTFLMRSQRAAGALDSGRLLQSVQAFQKKHPEDRRLAALLAEVASLFDAQPRTKRQLLSDARSLTTSEELKARVDDDLKRLDLIGEPLSLSFNSIQGGRVDTAAMRGKIVVVTYFASWSPPSIAALEQIKQALARVPGGRVNVVCISLDQKPELAAGVLREQGVNWPTACDGSGWTSPLVRQYGVNALPAVWVVDAEGRVRSTSALSSLPSQLRQLAPAAGG